MSGEPLRGVMTPTSLGVMTQSQTIKVRIAVTVEVDPAEWADEYDLDRSEVRTDVKNYFMNQILASTAAESVDFTVRVS